MPALADLLGHEHPMFAYNLVQLERAAGDSGVDTRLVADINGKAHHVLGLLGLDHSDTFPDELYQALNAAVRRGDAEKILLHTSYTLIILEGEVVSLNIQDVVENAHHQLVFADRMCESARRHLRAEIIRRYAEHDRTDNTLVEKLAIEAGLRPERDEGHVLHKDREQHKDAPTMYAIGDMFSDVFIQLYEDQSSVEEDEDGNEWLKLPFGSKPPYESVTTIDGVGPSPNAGVSAARLGVHVALLAWVGDDKVAQTTRRYLTAESIDHSTIQSAEGTPSNTYYVLRRGAERTILVKNQAYSYNWVEPPFTPDWVYLSLISESSWQLHEDMLEYLQAHPDVKLAFQPGTFHFKWGAKKLKKVYKRSEIVIMNREEAVDVTGGDHDNLRELSEKLHELGPSIVVITDGKDGSYAYYDDKLMLMPNYPDSGPPVDRTGAGDAFASTIVAALALGEDIETALTWAPINSMNVVQRLGAQAGLQTRAEIRAWLDKAPDDYQLRELSD